MMIEGKIKADGVASRVREGALQAINNMAFALEIVGDKDGAEEFRVRVSAVVVRLLGKPAGE